MTSGAVLIASGSEFLMKICSAPARESVGARDLNSECSDVRCPETILAGMGALCAHEASRDMRTNDY